MSFRSLPILLASGAGLPGCGGKASGVTTRDVSRRLRDWLSGQSAKGLARACGVSVRTAEGWKAGGLPQVRHLLRLIDAGGEGFVESVLLGTGAAPLDRLARMAHEIAALHRALSGVEPSTCKPGLQVEPAPVRSGVRAGDRAGSRAGALAARFAGLRGAPPAAYWVLPEGVQLAETGLMALAADLMGVADPSDLIDYAVYARKSLGAIAVLRRSGAPVSIEWDSSGVAPEALAHLLAALPGWDQGQGFQFFNAVSDSTRVFADAQAAGFEIERALRLARVANGLASGSAGAGRVVLSAEALGLEGAEGAGAGLLEAWYAHRQNPAAFGHALPGGVEGLCVLYRLSARGLVTDYIGAALPSIFGVPWHSLEGVATLSEPAHPDYRDMFVSHVLEASAGNQPSLYRVGVSIDGQSGAYTRLALPFTGPHGGGVMTYTSNIRGQECLAQLSC